MSVDEWSAAAPVQGGHDRYAGAIVVAAALVVVAATSVLTVRWFGGLDLVTPVANGVRVTAEGPGTVIVGTMIVANGPLDAALAADLEPVDVRSITPVVVENSAEADIVLLTCPQGAVGTEETVASRCAGATPVVPGSRVLSTSPPNDMIAVITTRRAGVVRIDGFRVDYASGIRSTTVDAGINVEVAVGAGAAPDDAVPPS